MPTVCFTISHQRECVFNHGLVGMACRVDRFQFNECLAQYAPCLPRWSGAIKKRGRSTSRVTSVDGACICTLHLPCLHNYPGELHAQRREFSALKWVFYTACLSAENLSFPTFTNTRTPSNAQRPISYWPPHLQKVRHERRRELRIVPNVLKMVQSHVFSKLFR